MAAVFAGQARAGIPAPAPTVQADSVKISNLTAATATIRWTNGNGVFREVFVAQASSGNPAPSATRYSANSNFHSGTQIGTSGFYCVYAGIGSSVNISNLTGNTIYRVMVFEANGTSGTPVFNVTTAANNPINFTTTADARLSGLVVSSGTLSPSFSINTTSYTDSVSYASGGITITPTANDPLATVTVNGTTVNTGSASGTIALNIGDNTITVVSTSADNSSTLTTSVIVKRADSPPAFSYTSPAIYTQHKAGANLAPAISAGTVGAPGANYQYTIGSGFINPHGIAADATGNVYVTDAGNNAIKKIPAGGGAIITLNSTFNYPCGVAVDATGNIYVAGYNDNSVWEMAADGTNKRALGSGFNHPQGVAVDAAGNVYVADSQNNAIKEITTGGTILTLGSGFNNPVGIALDASANIYVCDALNNAVKKIPAGGGTPVTIATITGPSYIAAGNNGKIYITGFNGYVYIVPAAGGSQVAIGQNFSNTCGAAVDALNNIFIADWNTNLVTKISAFSGYYISPALPAGLNFDSTTGSVSGIPAAISPATNYTVKGYNYYGSGTANINLSVVYDVSLSNLTLSDGTLSPALAGGTTTYTASVGNATGNITVTPTATDANATITVNDTSVTSGTSSRSILLHTGTNSLSVVVTAPDGITKSTYIVTIIRAASSIATLRSLVSGGGVLDQDFSPATTSYTQTVPYSTGSITLTPTSTDPNAIITVNRNAVLSGSASGTINLSVGSNTITTTVMAPDGVTTKNYTLMITRAASLASISVDNTNRNNGFGDMDFEVAFEGNIAGLKTSNFSVITTGSLSASPQGVYGPYGPYSDGQGGELYYYYVAVTYSGASGTVALTMANTTGINPSAISGVPGTSSDVVTISPYPAPTLTIGTPSGSNTAVGPLSFPVTYSGENMSVTLAPGNINVSTSGTAAYGSVAVTGSGTSFNVTLSGISGNGQLSISIQPGTGNDDNGNSDSGGSSSTVNIINDASLANLVYSNGSLSPVFTSGTTAYSDTVASTISSIIVTATAADPSAVLKVNGATVESGATSDPIPLNPGSNVITTTVTAQDGVTTKTYTTNIIQAASTDATLISLSPGTGSFDQAFSPTTINYTETVPYAVSTISLTPVTSDVNTSVLTINGAAVGSGTTSGNIELNVGVNTITTIVVAQDGSTINFYTLTITRAASPDASLSSLVTGTGAFDQAFDPNTNAYTQNVSNDITGITLTPTTDDTNATITVNNVAVASGAASGNISLNIGTNVITTTVTAQDGVTTKSYTLTVNRAKTPATITFGSLAAKTYGDGDFTAGATSNNGDSALIYSSGNTAVAEVLNDGTIQIKGAGTTNITVSQEGDEKHLAASDVTQLLTVSPAALTITANNQTMNYGGPVPVLTATITGFVNGDTQENLSRQPAITTTASSSSAAGIYTITASGALDANYIIGYVNGSLTILPSADASLLSLAISSGSFTANGAGGYTASVGNAITAVTITPVSRNSNAVIKVGGVVVASGAASAAQPLNVGDNFITVIITAQDGTTTNSYAVTVKRAASANDNLSAIRLSPGTVLTTVAGADYKDYTASVNNNTSSIQVIPTTSVATSTITVNGAAVSSGVLSAPIALNVGVNTITTVVTAENGISTHTYVILVTRAASNNANLSSVKLSPATALTVDAGPDYKDYTASVSNAITSISVIPTTTVNTATVSVNGSIVATGTASAPIPLAVGINTITTLVTAQDGISTRSYVIRVTRAPNVNLTALSLNTGHLSPVFTQAITGYTSSVGNATASITLTAVAADPADTIRINGVIVPQGSASPDLPLSIGPNIITTTVKAPDGTVKYYTITLTRLPSPNLAILKLSSGSLSPAFAGGTTSYTAVVGYAVSFITVKPTTADPLATVTINGTTVATGTASGNIVLSPGDNVITATVTARDGVITKTYTVVVTRAINALNTVYQPISVSNPTAHPQMMGEEILVHQGLSPNGDGINDFLLIDGITGYPDNKLQIMNRSGALVFEAKGYDNSNKVFDGHSNKTGAMQLPGTYFYSLDYVANGTTIHKTGFIVLKY
ncbi:cadherin-like beta sandwich domain-containing protein [Mucilaginibacter gotjawali]|nr:cadherin-like beta sandwich domain-containing protein [Mucilaginibacter gotjawali]MBB3059049.1 gliding motility-associated-like protein [Mucilaginibacter gotjawali]